MRLSTGLYAPPPPKNCCMVPGRMNKRPESYAVCLAHWTALPWATQQAMWMARMAFGS